jgi:hypothetical protein
VPGLAIGNPSLQGLRQGICISAWNGSEKPVASRVKTSNLAKCLGWPVVSSVKTRNLDMPGLAMRNPCLQGLRQGIWISGLPQNRPAAGPGCGIVAAAEPLHQQREASAVCTG